MSVSSQPSGDPVVEPAAGSLGLAAMAAHLERARATLSGLAQDRAHAEREWRAARSLIVQAGERAIATANEPPPPEVDGETRLGRLQAGRDAWLARITQAGTRRRRALRAELERAVHALEQTTATPPAARRARPPAEERAIAARLQSVRAAVEAMREQVSSLQAALAEDFRRLRIAAPTREPAPVPLPSWELGRRVELLQQELAAVEESLASIHDSSSYACCRWSGILGAHLLLAVPPVVALVLLVWFVPMPTVVPWVIGSAVVSQLLVILHTRVRRFLLARSLPRIASSLTRLSQRLGELENTGVRDLDPQLSLDDRLSQLHPDDRPEQIRALQATAQVEAQALRAREQAITARVTQRYALLIAATTSHFDGLQDRQRVAREAAVARASALLAGRLADHDAAWQQQHERLAVRWRTALAGLRAVTDAALSRTRQRFPAWSDPRWQTWTPATSYAGELPLGQATLALSALIADCGGGAFAEGGDEVLAIPITLAFPGASSLLIRTGTPCRAETLRIANQLVLRALTAFPPGRLRLTLIDPVGLGDSFAGLLDMADHDESLLTGGIVSDLVRIERSLDDLIAHLEMVIQKHLRGRYATIDDYNREAGELQESLRLVVVADFPANFSERALEQIAVLIRSGARCGVHLLILHDDSKPLPAVLDLAWFRQSGVLLREVQGHLAIDREGLHAWTFQPEPPPPAQLSAQLIAQVGLQAVGAKRIEVPFASVAPTADQLWSLNAAKHLSIPIGKRGADRQQTFDLGRGTCQHALIGGRTGSGKSTLFHVLITSGAMWYAPRELEFHLIDFKKGVEFKAFAAHRLPHARVIAIESDREFGVSVLRHLDQELTRRGDAFRTAGVQDLAGHRQAGGDYLPRILLLIDEFQEFFTEDDAIARDAALLLDRFVRQGRAFGLHVVLGSQTLGGSYALAKSSLGQMGVRIALPCNESDAHLLLHEDNDATRLLTRPGDAVYNDRAGLTEGNSPFQVCWLSEEQEAGHLQAIAAQARAIGWTPSRPPVIFEGNGPSHLEELGELDILLGRAHRAEDARLRACIGQSSSLAGWAAIDFPSAAGGNLLLVGPHREAAAATCGAILLGLGLRYPTGSLQLFSFDGEDLDGPFARLHGRLAERLPHAMPRDDARSLAQRLAELTALLEARQSGADRDRSPVILIIFALQRLRLLRPDEDAALGRDGGEPPAELLARLLAHGPEYDIHTVLWCDSLASVQRGLGRRSLRDFDQRILFQMSAADSTELIDDDGASRLGLHTAVLAVQGDGRREKFRPFALPGTPYLDQVAAAIAARTRSA